MTLTLLDAPDSGAPAVRVLGVPSPRVTAEVLPAQPRPVTSGPRHAKPSTSAAARGADLLLTLLALIGVGMTVVTVLAAHSGLRPLVVRSGSMEPTIPTGAMVLVRDVPASEIRVGDVVAVERADHTRVTHRVLSVEHHGRTADLRLKGDANRDPDADLVTVSTAGRLVATTPWLGRVGGFLASARGGFVLGCVVTAVLLGVLRRRKSPCEA